MINENYPPAHLEHDRRSHDRRAADKRNDEFKVFLILVACLAFVCGVYAGIQMEKTNQETLKAYQRGAR